MAKDDFQWEASLVFPLVPTARDYAKLNEYCGELQSSKIEVSQAHGDLGWNLSVRKVLQAIRNVCKVKWGGPKVVISDMKDVVKNTLLRAVDTISGCFGAANGLWNVRGIEELYNLESGLSDLEAEKETWKAENVAGWEEAKV